MLSYTNCEECYVNFDFDNHCRMFCPCDENFVCRECTLNYGNKECAFCEGFRYEQFIEEPTFNGLTNDKPTKETLEDENAKLRAEIEKHKEEHSKTATTLEEHQKEIEEMKKKLEELTKIKKERKVNDVKCSQCDFVDNEKCFNICRTCTKIQSKIDVLDIENSPGVDIKEFAICSTCSIRKHIRVGHNVIDFFPVLASNNHRIQSVVSKEFCSRMDQGMGKIKSLSTKWEGLVNDGKNGVLSMTDMLGQGRTSEVQKEMGKMIEEKSEMLYNSSSKQLKSLRKIWRKSEINLIMC